MRATRITLLACLLTALIYAVGLVGMFNAEAITFLVFVSGFLLGPWWGCVVGGASMGAHSLFSPLGTVPPPVFVSQVVSYAFIGFCGAWLGPVIARMHSRSSQALSSAAAGFLLVLVYQVIVNLVSFYSFAANVPLVTYLWGGILFTAMQLVWNAVLFFIVLPPVLKVLGKARNELTGKVAA